MGLDNISDVDAAYIAGVIDCDGCVHLVRRDSKRNRNIQYSLEVSFSNTSIELIDYLREQCLLAGYTFTNKVIQQDNRSHRKHICYTYRVSGENALLLLQRVLPFIVAKREQVRLAIRFGLTKGFQQGSKSLTPLYPIFQQMYEDMRVLKGTDDRRKVYER